MNQFCPKCGAKLYEEGMTNRNTGMWKSTKWGRRKKKPVNWDMEK